MIEGIFKKKHLWNRILIICGILLIIMYLVDNIVDPEGSRGFPFIVVLGILSCSLGIISELYNRNAYVFVENGYFSAKYAWFKTINISISDIEFSSWVIFPGNSDLNTLSIKLKNGKLYRIASLENPDEISAKIHRFMRFEPNKSIEDYHSEFLSFKKKRKLEIIYTCIGILLMTINLILMMTLTGDKEFYEFTKNDWIKTYITGSLTILMIIISIYYACRAGNKLLDINRLQYNIQRISVESSILPPGNPYSIFTDGNYCMRLSLMKYPNGQEIYYTLEEFDQQFELQTTYISEIFENEDNLPFSLDKLINITDLFNK